MKILIADSGGTGTDWCMVHENGEKKFLSGVSYHPMYLSKEFIENQKLFWSKEDVQNTELYFFGAGCLNPDNALKVKNALIKIGFENVQVKSDIHAAHHALMGSSGGNLAIMGTGSVFAEFDGTELKSIQGGLGYLLGDEGSGFYYGKLLIKSLLEGGGSESLKQRLFSDLGDRTQILKSIYGEQGRTFLASLSKSYTASEGNEFKELHKLNIETFLIPLIEGNSVQTKGISFCGSYAFHNRDLIKEILQVRNISAGEFVERPIGRLTDYFLSTTF